MKKKKDKKKKKKFAVSEPCMVWFLLTLSRETVDQDIHPALLINVPVLAIGTNLSFTLTSVTAEAASYDQHVAVPFSLHSALICFETARWSERHGFTCLHHGKVHYLSSEGSAKTPE